jgi:hypothetical protein
MTHARFLAATLLICGLGASQLFAQAAAESVLTHGLSSTAGSGLGKTLGNAVGNAASQLGGRLGQQTSTAVQYVPAAKVKTAGVPVPATTPATASSSGSLIASIQGGATSTPTCAATSKTAEANSSPAKATTATPVPATPAQPATTLASVSPASNCEAAQDPESHPAVVNLPAAN